MTNCHELPTEKISLSFLMKSYHTSFIKQKVFVHFFSNSATFSNGLKSKLWTLNYANKVLQTWIGKLAILQFCFSEKKNLPDFPSKNCKINSNKIFERYCIKIKYMVCCVVNWFSHSPLRMEFTRANAWKVVATSSPLQSELRCLLLDLFSRNVNSTFFDVNKTLYLRDCLSKLIYDQFLKSKHKRFSFFYRPKSFWKLGRKLQIMIIFILELWIEKMIENRGGEVK